ncbi:MAG: hypothetical protein LBI60_04220 [Bacteroidales bacterium]|jgi:hypothetical protein|nr:hypothetical protein [Bacteroidales bacterium]
MKNTGSGKHYQKIIESKTDSELLNIYWQRNNYTPEYINCLLRELNKRGISVETETPDTFEIGEIENPLFYDESDEDDDGTRELRAELWTVLIVVIVVIRLFKGVFF